MRRAFLSGVLILLYGYCQDARAKKPEIFPAEETLYLKLHGELRINCYSKGAKLQFSFLGPAVKRPRPDHEILLSANGTYTLLQRTVRSSDTGWYACAEAGIRIDNHFSNLNHTHEDISWIYVYVIHGDAEEFTDFVYNHQPKNIIVIAGSIAVVPCRPTSPSVYVKLWQNFKLVRIDGTAVKFDPKIGFIMKEVDFEDGVAILRCEINTANREDYILRLSGTKPTMITAGSELTVQEGDELRIECYSETKLSFLFPEMLYNTSKYEIFVNKSGVSTFLRSSTVADDTGWYGCAGAGEGIQNDIPYYSIDYTEKEISWIYVHVNCTLCETLPPRREFSYENPFSFQKMVWKDPEVAMVDAEDPLAATNLSIRMTGEELRLLCEVVAPELTLFHAGWKIPNTVSEDRVQYNRTRTDRRFDNSVYLSGKKLIMTIKNISETDSGEYSCFAQSIDRRTRDVTLKEVSRHVEVFDKNGERYIKLSEQLDTFEVTGVEGTTVRWLIDLEDFPSAKISWCVRVLNYISLARYEGCGQPENPTHMNTIFRRGSTYMLFTMSHLALTDNGKYRLSADIENVTALDVDVTINVLGTPVVSITKLDHYWYKPGERVTAHCSTTGRPTPNITWSFLNCPKFPSRKDSHQMNLYTPDTLHMQHSTSPDIWSAEMIFSINASGILTCETCNLVNCSIAETQVFYSDTDKPYFISTNLNQSEVTWSRKIVGNNTRILECYVAGRPYPNVIWFKDDILLKGDERFKFAYDNRQLSILYFWDGDSGRYMCRAENEHGKVENYVDITIEGESDLWRSGLYAAAAVLLGVIVVSWVVIWRQRIEASERKSIDLAFKDGALYRMNPELSVVDQAELLPYDLKWEYPRELLTLDKILGSGAFGIVKKATAKSICRGEPVTTVAVKLVRSKASLNYITALSRELKILVHLGKHINVVNLLGACTKHVSYGELLVIVEYCHFGNLHDYLFRGRADFIDQTRSKTEQTSATDVDEDLIDITDEILYPNDGALTMDRDQHTGSATNSLLDEDRISGEDPGNALDLRSKYKGDYEDTNLEPISTRDLIYWSWQVSRGMDYLGNRKVVHGDLAARNILLADNGIVKISDFGLSKALYEEAQHRDKGVDPLPVKWMAIESIKDRVFSYQSDIWSFGIVMWEFFTLAKTPYPGIRSSELYHELINGHRMEKPEYAATAIYDTMLDCWESDPSKRPSFVKLAESLGNLLDEGFKTRYIEMNSPYLELDESIFEDGKKDYLTMSPTAFDVASASTTHEKIEMQNLSHDESINFTAL